MSHSVDESYDVYREEVRKAIKEHICDACQRTISKGHTYCSVYIVFDGEAKTVKRCGSCQTMHEHLRKIAEPVGMWPNEKLNCGSDYEEEWDTEPPEEVVALAFMTDDEAGKLLQKKRHETAV